MAQALANGFLQAGKVTASELTGSDIDPRMRERFAERTGASTFDSNVDAIASAEIVLLAVKPQVMATVLDEIAGAITPQKLVISIAAGIPLSQLANRLGANARLVRVMPNTPCLVGAGACGYSLSVNCTAEDGQTVQSLLEAVGIAFQLPEHQLDAVTGLSGSGPAYVYQVIEALSDGGVRAGLPRQVATQLAAQTVFGAAKMVLETGQHPGALKDMVTSPAGTTIEGLYELESRGVRGALMAAVASATRRARELGS